MNVILKNQLKKIYKQSRNRDTAEVGRKVNSFVQQIHQEIKKTEPDKEKLQSLSEQIKELTTANRFKNDFPSFSSFKKFVKKEKLSPKDLE